MGAVVCELIALPVVILGGFGPLIWLGMHTP